MVSQKRLAKIETMQIKEIAKQSGFSRDTIRYYEKIGLIQLDKKQRDINNYRNYSEANLQKLLLIRQMKNIGFTLNEIKDLMRMDELNWVSCDSVSSIIKSKLEKIEQQLLSLQKTKGRLLDLMNRCSGNCIETIGHQSL